MTSNSFSIEQSTHFLGSSLDSCLTSSLTGLFELQYFFCSSINSLTFLSFSIMNLKIKGLLPVFFKMQLFNYLTVMDQGSFILNVSCLFSSSFSDNILIFKMVCSGIGRLSSGLSSFFLLISLCSFQVKKYILSLCLGIGLISKSSVTKGDITSKW